MKSGLRHAVAMAGAEPGEERRVGPCEWIPYALPI